MDATQRRRKAAAVVSRLSSDELVAEDAISEAVARFALSECERVLSEYHSGELTISEALWTINGVTSQGARVILRHWSPWHEERAS